MKEQINQDDRVRRWHVIAGLMQQFNLKTLVEVGCKEGRTTEFVLKNIPDSRVTAIDPWIVQPEKASVPGGESFSEWDFDHIASEFHERTAPVKDRLTMYRLTSEQASGLVESADIAFIDGLHDYASVVQDIDLWGPKVRVIAGHDYNDKHPEVMRAVADRFCLMDVGIGPDSVWFVAKGAA